MSREVQEKSLFTTIETYGEEISRLSRELAALRAENAELQADARLGRMVDKIKIAGADVEFGSIVINVDPSGAKIGESLRSFFARIAAGCGEPEDEGEKS